MTRSVLAGCALGLMAFACGGDDAGGGADGGGGGADTASATVYYCDSTAQNEQCSEYSSPTPALVADFMTSCTETLSGTLVASCPAGMVGGCQSATTVESFLVWFYPPNTVEDVDCGSRTFVPPP